MAHGYKEPLEEARRRLVGVVPVDTVLVEGMPFVQIAAVAEQGGYDEIVMGTHERTGLGHVLLGSVAERVVRRALCPVLTVHERAAPRSSPPSAV